MVIILCPSLRPFFNSIDGFTGFSDDAGVCILGLHGVLAYQLVDHL